MVPGMILESAARAAGNTFIFVLLGNVALSIVGSLVRPRIPTPPPGLTWSTFTLPGSVSAWVHNYRLWILWTIFFGFALWLRFRQALGQQGEGDNRWTRAGQRLSENWFGIFVGNAIGASIGAFIVTMLGQFSLRSMLVNEAWASLVRLFPHSSEGSSGGLVGFIRAFWSWFAANQLNLTFWMFFLAAVLDDLGLPNFKTWGRHRWRRFRRRHRSDKKPSPTQTP